MATRFSSYLDLASRIWRSEGNRGWRLFALLRSIGWLINKKTIGRPWTIRVFGSVSLRCYPDSTIAEHVVYRSEWFDAEVSRFLEHYLTSGDTFVDIGANIGLYTLAAATWVGRGGRVFAVEPSPVNLARLRENLLLNGEPEQVAVYPWALGEAAGIISFDDADARARVALNLPRVRGQLIEVPTRRFDDIDPGVEIALTKIDVEGYELQVLKGATRALVSGRMPVILLEMNYLLETYGLRPSDLLAFLQAHGYRVGHYDPARRTLSCSTSPAGELVAFTNRGADLIEKRIGGLRVINLD